MALKRDHLLVGHLLVGKLGLLEEYVCMYVCMCVCCMYVFSRACIHS